MHRGNFQSPRENTVKPRQHVNKNFESQISSGTKQRLLTFSLFLRAGKEAKQDDQGRVIRCWVFIRVPGNRALVLQEVVPVVGVANKQTMRDMTLTFLALVELIHFHHSGCSA